MAAAQRFGRRRVAVRALAARHLQFPARRLLAPICQHVRALHVRAGRRATHGGGALSLVLPDLRRGRVLRTTARVGDYLPKPISHAWRLWRNLWPAVVLRHGLSAP